jgi:outer membrane immunogenic protein
MKSKIIRTGIAVAALSIAPIAASAAELPMKAPSYSAPSYSEPADSGPARFPTKAPAYSEPPNANWTGFYIGLNAGYAFGKSNWDVPEVSPSPKGAVYGATFGYNLQTGMWLWGAEGDFDLTSIKGSADCSDGFICETKNTWLATGRVRLGYAGWDNWLPYITGGVAMGDIKATNSWLSSASKTKLGWTAGIGLEYAMWTNWSVKAEYLYVDLGSFDCGIACSGASDNVSFKTNIVRAGVNYRF